MNRPPDRHTNDSCIEAAVEALDRIADATDANSDRTLNAARREALGATGARASPWFWAAATATVAALAVAIVFFDRDGNDLPPLTEQLVADAELYQEMEFYLWLSEELESK